MSNDFWKGYVPEPMKPAQQEPVASVPIHPKTGPLWAMTTDKPDPERLPSYPLMRLYTAPPAAKRQWVGLTDDERKFVRNSVGYNQFVTASEYAEHVQKATESKLKERNT